MQLQVACRTLGYTSGAEILSGLSSPFPAPGNSTNIVEAIRCNGSEAELDECIVEIQSRPIDYEGFAEYNYGSVDYDYSVENRAVALVCSTPSGEELHTQSYITVYMLIAIPCILIRL